MLEGHESYGSTVMIASLSLTNSCNYHCDYCIAKAYTSHAKQCSKSGRTEIRGCVLDLDAVLMYLDKFVPQGSTIVLTGGEPMTVPYFGTLLKALAPSYKIIIETNGSQLFKFESLQSLDCSNIRLLIAWHPKMIKLEKFKENLKRCRFPHQFIKLVQIDLYANGNKTTVNEYPSELPFSVITNDGAMPDCGYPINEPYIFVRANGRVMGCPSAEAKQIGDIYDGTLDTGSLYGYKKCFMHGGVWCNSFKNIYLAFS